MKTHNTLKELYRRDETIWDMFTRTGWSMQDIANIFKISKTRVYEILTLCEKRKGEELRVYEDIHE